MAATRQPLVRIAGAGLVLAGSIGIVERIWRSGVDAAVPGYALVALAIGIVLVGRTFGPKPSRLPSRPDVVPEELHRSGPTTESRPAGPTPHGVFETSLDGLAAILGLLLLLPGLLGAFLGLTSFSAAQPMSTGFATIYFSIAGSAIAGGALLLWLAMKR